MSIARLVRKMSSAGREGKTAVVVGTVTNDLRILEIPKPGLHIFKKKTKISSNVQAKQVFEIWPRAGPTRSHIPSGRADLRRK